MSETNTPYRRICLWLAKSLGLACFKHLLSLSSHNQGDNYPTSTVTQVVLSEKDETCAEIAALARQHSIPVNIINDVGAKDARQHEGALKKIGAGRACERGFIVGFPHKLPAEVIAQVQYGVINLHFAPLPQYRGSGTLTQAILDGANEFGVTLHYIDEHLDTGPILEVGMLPLGPDETVMSYTPILEKFALSFFQKHALRLLRCSPVGRTQDELSAELALTPTLCTRAKTRQVCQLSPQMSEEELYRAVRACTISQTKLPTLQLCGRTLTLTLDSLTKQTSRLDK